MIGEENSDQFLKGRRSRSREVSSRFLSPTLSSLNHSAASTQGLSPIRRKPSNADARKSGSLEDPGASRGGLWPSSATATSSSSSPLDKKLDTLGKHLGNDRLKDLVERRKDEKSGSSSNNKKTSSTENDRDGSKENHKPIIGGSLRFNFPGKSSIVPGRLSVDESALYRQSLSRRHSDVLGDNVESFTDYGSSKDSSFSMLRSTKPSVNDAQTRPKKASKFSIKNAMRRANSLTGYGSATSQWALSPGRSASPPISVDHKNKLMSFSSLKPPTSPSRATGVDKLLHLGLHLFKTNKSCSSTSLGPAGPVDVDHIHQLRLLHNRFVQLRYANARADSVNENIAKQTQINLVYAWDGLKKLQHSALQKRVQLEKEKLKMKLNFILHSQIKLLETWGDMERQHTSAVSMTRDSLHSVVCKVPLVEGAKISPQSASIALRHAWGLTASIQSILTSFTPTTQETVSELAAVVVQEKLLLEEFRELFITVSSLEMQERSMKCTLIQLKS